MSTVDGIDLLQSVRRKGLSTPVIFMSALNSAELAHSAGADLFISKNNNVKAIAESIAVYCGKMLAREGRNIRVDAIRSSFDSDYFWKVSSRSEDDNASSPACRQSKPKQGSTHSLDSEFWNT